jgi:hypothetical protein
LTIGRDTVTTWRAEFDKQLRDALTDLTEVPRWPLTKYALRLAQLGELENALEMARYNRHFQPADAKLIRMEAALQAIIAEKCEQARCRQGTTAA